MDGCMTCDFTSFSTVFQSYQNDGRMLMKGRVQWKSVYEKQNGSHKRRENGCAFVYSRTQDLHSSRLLLWSLKRFFFGTCTGGILIQIQKFRANL